MLLKTSYEQDHIAHSPWPDELPNYLHAVIIDALSASHAFTTVNNRRVNNTNNYKLLLKVSAFQAELSKPKSSTANVDVKMEAFLLHSQNQKLLMHKRYRVDGENIEVRVSSLVKALSKALDLLVADLKVSAQ